MASPSNMSRQAKVYQIDFTAVACGKRVASSKRRVRWRFGFANPRALASGATGNECRGEEHDVTFVWSISSGKRTIMFDGQEVHFSSSRSSIFDYSWTIRGNHVLKIVAHASPPMGPTPGFRQYDFMVDGLTFYRFPKLYRLGLSPNDPRASISPRGAPELALRGNRYSNPNEIPVSVEAPNNPDEEEAYLQEAIRQSLEDDGPSAKQSAAPSADLLGFDSPPALPPSSQYAANDFFGAPAQQPYQVAGYPDSQHNPFAQQLALPPSATTTTNQPHGATDPWGQPVAAPAPTSYPGYPPQPVYDAQQQHPSSHQLVPIPMSSDMYAASYGMSTPQATNGYGPTTTGMQSQPTPSSNTNTVTAGYGYPPQHPQPGSPAPLYRNATGVTEASVYATSNPSTSQWTPPPPIVTGAHGGPLPYQQTQEQQQSLPEVPQGITPQAVGTPSTLGFGSPDAEFGFGSPAPQVVQEEQANAGWEQGAPAIDFSGNNGFVPTMNGNVEAPAVEAPAAAANAPSSVVDQVYSKLVNFDSFSISSKQDAPRANPFEMSASVGGSKSLADIQATKASAPKKEVMRTPMPAPTAVTQHNVPYGMQPPTQPDYGAPQQAGYGQQPLYGQSQQPPQPQAYDQGYGMPQPTPQPAYGQIAPPHPQPVYGQPQYLPMQQQQQAQQSYGQQPQYPPMQQSFAQPPPPAAFGQPSYNQQTTFF